MDNNGFTLDLFQKYLRDGRIVLRCVMCDTPDRTVPYFVRIDMVCTINGSIDKGLFVSYRDLRRDDYGRPQLYCDVRSLGEKIGDRSIITVESIITDWKKHIPCWINEDSVQAVFQYTSSFISLPTRFPTAMLHLGSLRALLYSGPHGLNTSEPDIHKVLVKRYEALLTDLSKRWRINK